MDADENQFHVIIPKLQEQGERGLTVLTHEIDRMLPPDLPSSDESREKLAKRQANAAVTLLKMNQPEKVWPLLKHSPDPRLRSYLIHRLSPLGADAQAIVKQIDNEPDVTIRRALILSMGEFSEQALSLQDRTSLLPRLQQMYRMDADPGIHGACEWLLQQWRHGNWLKDVNAEWKSDQDWQQRRLESIQTELGSGKASVPGTLPQWYVNSQGQTLVILPGPVQFLMGSPNTELNRMNIELQHKKRIDRTFAISTASVTIEQFLAFNAQFSHTQMYRYPEPTCPIGGVTWYEAAAYCNWLSKQEGISEDQWCYEITDQQTKLKKDSLSLEGYRLPTEAEMEYATRAETTTARYYGETEELLSKYAWFANNCRDRAWPAGRLKPNDFGLFDVHGNVWEWCHGAAKDNPLSNGADSSDDQDDRQFVVESTIPRVLRGGSFFTPASFLHIAMRYDYVPTSNYFSFGIRIARTFPLVADRFSTDLEGEQNSGMTDSKEFEVGRLNR
jgi:formylglycine-generating enzyme required for sulfatase activity